MSHLTRTHYEVLGIERYADISEIKSAYKAQALKTHPDKNGGTPKAKEAFQQLVNAYEVLSDEAKRRSYDQTLPPAYFSPSWSTQPVSDHFTHFSGPTWPTQPPPSSKRSDWPSLSETFINGQSASWWKKYEEEERRREEEEEEQARKRAKEEAARKQREEQQKGKTHEKEKLYGESSRKQRERAEQRERREREIEEIREVMGEALRVAREWEGKGKRTEW